MSTFPSRLKSARATPRPCWWGSSTPGRKGRSRQGSAPCRLRKHSPGATRECEPWAVPVLLGADGETQLPSQNVSIGVRGETAIGCKGNQRLVFKLHLPSKQIIFTQFWGSSGCVGGETGTHSGGRKPSPATSTLLLGHIKLIITRLFKSLSGSPVLLGQV